MPPFLRYALTRILSIPVTLLVVTAVLYGFIMLTPPKSRVMLYVSPGILMALEKGNISQEQFDNYIERTIVQYHLRDPYPVQYAIWLGSLVQGNWGFSPVIGSDVLPALIRRTPVTAELAIYSLLLFIPLGLVFGVSAGSRKDSRADQRFRLAAFIGTSMPPFILAIVLLSIFYVSMHWFPPERLGFASSQVIRSPAFHAYTGLLTIDGLLNGQPGISLDAARHLVLPVITLSLVHWATLSRITRASIIEELQKEYITAGKARGISNRALVWKHAFRNTLSPALTSSILSAAALFTGIFVVEVIFNFRGVSDLIVSSIGDIPDPALALGFVIYSVVVVLILMLALDIIQALVDPRIREGILTR
jgi:peptide/nickel transport system permease protein